MNILLIQPRLEPQKSYHYMPYSLLCVAARLTHDGHNVKIHDERIKPLDLKNLTWADKVMLTAYTGYQVTDMYRLVKEIKSVMPKMHITLGGPHATLFPEQCITDPYIDDIWTGYAERGDYPIPWELINVKDYINPATERAIYISSYGCPGICTFCATPERRELIFIPLEKVKTDIDNLMAIYPFKEMVFFDATVMTKPGRAGYIASLMKYHNLKWICDSRADEICRTPQQTLGHIVNSGLRQITIGLESGSQRVVERMKKGKNHLESFLKCAEILSKYDITMCSGVIFGTPGETPEDIRQSAEYIRRIRKINPNLRLSTTFYMPLPSTEMAEMCKQYGYVEPSTLAGWAERGENGHFYYNQWSELPWVIDKEKYKVIYDKFAAENSDIFI